MLGSLSQCDPIVNIFPNFNDFHMELQRKLRYAWALYQVNQWLQVLVPYIFSDKSGILWDPNPYSKSYGIMVAYYMFYLARILSLFDSFIYILKKKQMNSYRIVIGVFYGIIPIHIWVMAHFGNIPSHDLDLVFYVLTHCLFYVYCLLVTLGNY